MQRKRLRFEIVTVVYFISIGTGIKYLNILFKILIKLELFVSIFYEKTCIIFNFEV